MPGQKLMYLMGENPMLVDDGIERELEALSLQQEGEERLEAELSSSRAKEGDPSALQGRMADVRRSERSRAASELMYMTLCQRFRRMGAPLAPSLREGGYANLGTAKLSSLTTDIHSPESLEMVKAAVARTVMSSTGMPWDMDGGQPVQMPLALAGQLYATTVLFGHLLRLLDAKFQLEKSTGGSGAGGPAKLQEYAQRFSEEQMQDMGHIASLEAQVVAEIQVFGMFGDIRQLNRKLVDGLGPVDVLDTSEDVKGKLQAAMERNQVATLRFQPGDLRRFLLEAVAFGGFISDVARQVGATCELTPGPRGRLEELFGLGAPSGAGGGAGPAGNPMWS